MGVMPIYLHWFDVALCNITVKDAAVSLALDGHPCNINILCHSN